VTNGCTEISVTEEMNATNTMKSIEVSERTHAYHQIISSFRNIKKHLPNLMKGNQHEDSIAEFVDILRTVPQMTSRIQWIGFNI
jgi:hypothetical protein